MSKVTEALNAKGMHNCHNLVNGQRENYAVTYTAWSHAGTGHGWHMFCTTKTWAGPWYNSGNYSMNRPDGPHGVKDNVKALRIASKESGVLRWSPSPFSPRTAFVPTSVLEAHGIKPTRVFDFTEAGTSPSSSASR